MKSLHNIIIFKIWLSNAAHPEGFVSQQTPPSLRYGMIHQSCPLSAFFQLVHWQHLGQHVRSIIVRMNLHEVEIPFFLVFSIFVFGYCLPDSLLLVNSVEPTRFVFSMLNLCSTFITYFSYDNHNNFFVLSRTMCIPKICFDGPIFFIANDLLKVFFSFRFSSGLVRQLACRQRTTE